MWHKNCPVCLFLIMTIALALPLHAREQVTLTTSDGLKVYADFYPASSSGSNPAAIRAPFIAPIVGLGNRPSLAFAGLQLSVKIAGPHERNPIHLVKESGPVSGAPFVFRVVKRFRSQTPRAQVANQFQ